MQRPTFGTAKGGGGGGLVTQGGYFTGGAVSHAVSVRALPAHTTLKFRESGQTTDDDLQRRNLRRELEEKERQHYEKVKKDKGVNVPWLTNGSSASAQSAMLTDASSVRDGASVGVSSAPAKRTTVDDILAAFGDEDDDVLDKANAARKAQQKHDSESSDEEEGEERGAGAGASGLPIGFADSDHEDDRDEDGSDDEDEDEEDDTEELMRELERIKKEREEERLRREREAAELSERAASDSAAKSNPLMAGTLAGAGAAWANRSAAIKRRFGDDTVFSHTHSQEPEAKKRFINDILRSDFHRSFLKKYVA